MCDWLSPPQMEDGAHRKRINCLISAVRYRASAGGQALERGVEGEGGGGTDDGNRKGK